MTNSEIAPSDSKDAGLATVSVASDKEKVLHPEFAHRLGLACDSSPHCPALNHGRLNWIREQLKKRHGKTVTNESVRRWLAGEARPRPQTLSFLASIMQVEEAWLSVGASAETAKEQRGVRLSEKGAATVVAGLIQMAGNQPAFPQEKDERAKSEHVDLYAIIRGAQYAFHVTLGICKDATTRFNVPVDAARTFVLGVVASTDLDLRLYEIPHEMIVAHPVKSGSYEITVEGNLRDSQLRRITTFAERL